MMSWVGKMQKSETFVTDWVTVSKTEPAFVKSLCVCVRVCKSYNPGGLRVVCTHSVFSCCFSLIPPVYTGNEPLLALTLPAASLLPLLPESKSPDVGLVNTQSDQAALLCCLHTVFCRLPFDQTGWTSPVSPKSHLYKTNFPQKIYLHGKQNTVNVTRKYN